MRIFIALITFFTLITSMSIMNSQAQNPISSTHSVDTTTPAEFTAPDFKTGTIQHIVLFRYKPMVSAEQRKEVFDRFVQLKDKAKRDGKSLILFP